MKKRIVLESPVVLPYKRTESAEAAALETRNSRPAPMHHLDDPPDGEMLLRAFVVKAASLLTKGRRDPSERILVAEDEVAIRQIYFSALTRCGFQVDMAEDGEAAWNALQKTAVDANGYDLLVTDHKMPRLSGTELIQRLQSARIDLPVILASGALPAGADGLRVAAILPKPFPLDLLIKTVREVLHVAKNE